MPPLRLLPAFLAFAATLPAQPAQSEPPPDPPQRERNFTALSAAELAAIDAAAPARARAKPARPRRVLVFDRTEGFVHASIPYGNEALRRLGEKTGAFTVTVRDDMAAFTAASLADYDAVVFQNTTRLAFNNPAHRQALLDFVASGKGLAGLHAASDNFPTWPEGQALLGGVFHSHPWNAGETSAVKLDEPTHTLNAAFGGRGFWIREEIYQIVGPYGRDRQRVLLSLDMSRPENARPAEKIKRTDGDFPISWIKTHGAGRVFYTSLGHNKDIYTTPRLLAHILDGLQYALGDLPADAVPSASLPVAPVPALAPDDQTTLQKLAAAAAIDAWDALATYTREQQPDSGPRAVAAQLRALPPAARLVHEPRLIAVLSDDAAPLAARREAALLLALTGGPAAVSALETAGRSPEFADVAARVLTGLDAPSAAAARLRLLQAAPDSSSRILWLNTFALRPSADALPALLVSAASPAPVGPAALSAIAALGDRDALRGLSRLRVGPELAPARRAALLSASDHLLRAGESPSPRRTFGRLSSRLVRDSHTDTVVRLVSPIVRDASAPAVDRIDAARLLLLAEGPSAAKRLILLLASSDLAAPLAREIALLADSRLLARLGTELPRLPVPAQLALFTALGERGSADAVPLLTLALANAAPDARPAAARSLGLCGDPTTLDTLIPLLTPPGPLADAARFGLEKLRAPGLETTLRTRLTASEPAQRAVLLSVLAARQDRDAFALAIAACGDANDAVRAAAFEAVATLGRPGDLDAVASLVSQLRKNADRREWRRALFTAAATEPDGAAATRRLGIALAATDLAERPAFIGALSLITHPDATAALEALLGDTDLEKRKEIIRALSSARTEGAFTLLFAQARNATDSGERILALRGYLETLTNLPNMSRSARFAAYRDAWPLAERREEKQAILDAVRKLSGTEAAEFVKAHEAELATPVAG